MPLADVNGTKLNYCLDGSEQGTVVMFSNSLASALSMWDLQVPPLVKAGYRVLRYDSRGHGQSEVPAGPYSIEMLTADAVGVDGRPRFGEGSLLRPFHGGNGRSDAGRPSWGSVDLLDPFFHVSPYAAA